MPYFSIFTPFGLFEFSNQPSKAEQVYQNLLAGYRDPKTGQMTIDCAPGTHHEAKLYGWAMAIADAMMHAEQAGRELRAETSYYNLRAHERRYQVSPPPDATVSDRRDELAARQKAARGPRYEAMVGILYRLLGDDFLAYRPISVEELETFPPNGDDVGVYPLPEVVGKVVRITEAVARINVPCLFSYENWNAREEEVLLGSGDHIVVDPGNWGTAERVEIISSTGTGVNRKAVAVFKKAHSNGVFGSTGTMPLWMSTKRHVMIVVAHRIAVDPTMRARINTALDRVMRGATTWSIVEPNQADAANMGPFKLASSPLGAVPIELMSTLIVPYGIESGDSP